jgi:Flp pilus assembly protein TadG
MKIRRSADDRGAAAVEFAVVVPIVFLLLFGMIDYGVMLSFRQSVSQSAAEGARAGAVTPAGGSYTTNAANAVTEALGHGITCSGGNLTKSGSNVGTCTVSTGACTANTSKTCITVTVSYNYEKAPVIPKLPMVPMPKTLKYTAVSEVN